MLMTVPTLCTVQGKDPQQLTDKLSKKYNVMADFLTDNKLKVNDDKTHMLVMTTWQKRRLVDTDSTRINTPTSTVTPSPTERLLGAEVHHNLGWREHILDSDNSMVKRLETLKKVQKMASFKSRKLIAEGIFMSKLIYLMPLWAGCEDYLIKVLQVIQNKAARSVAKLGIYTPTRVLLITCGWLSVIQLMVYHSIILLHKTLANKAPEYLYKKVTHGGEFSLQHQAGHSVNTRLQFHCSAPNRQWGS